MNRTDLLGNQGENKISELFSKKVDGKYLFFANFLGEKFELLDFVVHLLGDDGRFIGPYFFIQVKASETIDETSIPANFTKHEVEMALERKVPVYLAAVGIHADDKWESFVLAVDSSQKTGISRVPRLYSLSDSNVRRDIYFEVKSHFESNEFKALSFKSKFKRKTSE